MTNIIHPKNFRAITALDAQKRKRHLAGSDVLADGEALHFSINLIDSAASGLPRFFTDAERAIRAQVDREHGAHDAKFAFMGDSAPAFDRERAEFLARAKFGVAAGDSAAAHPATSAVERTRSLAGARYQVDSSKRVDAAEGDKPAPRSLNAATSTQDAAQAKPAAISALRAARYS